MTNLFLRRLVVAGAMVLTLIGVGAIWVVHQLSPGVGPGREVEVTIPSGASGARIGAILAADQVIAHPFWFRIYVRLHGGHFLAGVYNLRTHDSFADTVKRLEGQVLSRRLVIPEGFTVSQIAARVGHLPGHRAAAFLALADSGRIRSPYEPPGSSNLEGLLFPDTYRVTVGASDEVILREMIDRFDQVAHQVGLSSAQARVGVTPYQALVVASLIEREAKLATDRPLVAEVVYNRLAAGMRLQIDASVLYALGPGHTGSGLTDRDLAVASPYNTYVVAGLPPAPISNPGLAALRAAVEPAKGNYLYYVVVQPDGQEAFSSSLAGQEANIALARRRGLAG